MTPYEGMEISYHLAGTQRKDNLFSPRAAESGQNVLVGYVLNPRLIIVFRVVAENDTVNPVSGAAQPAFFDVVQDCFYLGLGALHISHLANGHAESTS